MWEKYVQLKEAAIEGNLSVVEKVIFEVENISHKDENEMTPLMYAAEAGHTEIVITFLEVGVNCEDMCEALKCCACEGHLEIVRIMVDEIKKTYDGERDFIYSGLTSAIYGNNTEIAQMLVDEVKSIDGENSQEEETALMVAASGRDLEVVKLLLSRGAKVNIKREGGTALICAAEWGDTEILKMLIAAGADINMKNEYGETALIRAASFGYIDIIKILLANGADVSVVDSYGKSALTYSIEQNDLEAEKLLQQDKRIYTVNHASNDVGIKESKETKDTKLGDFISREVATDSKGVYSREEKKEMAKTILIMIVIIVSGIFWLPHIFLVAYTVAIPLGIICLIAWVFKYFFSLISKRK